MWENDLNWQTWLEKGDQYLKSGSPKGKKTIFSGDIIYNLLSMALESYAMAILDYHDALPDNHTYTDLIYGLDMVQPLDKDLRERILAYESIQSICSVDKYIRQSPKLEELVGLRGAIVELKDIAHNTCVETVEV